MKVHLIDLDGPSKLASMRLTNALNAQQLLNAAERELLRLTEALARGKQLSYGLGGFAVRV